jgi:beta-xylosidase
MNTKQNFCLILSSLNLILNASISLAQTTGNNGTHDPSRMLESNGKLYVYSTGGGSKSSTDGLAWTTGPGIFAGTTIPQAATAIVSSNQGVWAPDGIFYNNKYFMFYSIANSSNACAIGVLTSPTLDPAAANFKWTDGGVVVSNPNTTYCAIDPAPVVDATGNLWLAWGSGYSKKSTDQTIYVTRLDNTTGLASAEDAAKPGHALQPGHIEASYIHYHAGYYYLFWNSGGCCSGASSSYSIHVARSQTITGPYTGTKKDWYSSTGSIHGPGHIGIYDQCGYSRFTYHYYPDAGGSVLGENELSWGSDGYPVVGAVSKTPIKPCGAVSGIITPNRVGIRPEIVHVAGSAGNHLLIRNVGRGCALDITNASGRTVLRKVYQGGEGEINLPLTSIEPGMFQVRVTTPEGISNRNLVLMH